MSEVSKYYDEYTIKQLKKGIHHRHLSIQFHLEQYGLRRTDKVLEVGCGIGTVSELILRYLTKKGFLHAVDISDKSIQIANERLSKYNNRKIEVKDLTIEKIDDQFDVIVLPDVIEHIPLELHINLFKNLKEMLKDDGFILIHIPHPNFLAWKVEKNDSDLQIIDQPIHTNILCDNIYSVGLFIEQLKSYSIYKIDNDYQFILLRKLPTIIKSVNKEKYFSIPFSKKVLNKLRYIFRGSM